MRCPRATAAPCADASPATTRSRTSSASCRTSLTWRGHDVRGCASAILQTGAGRIRALCSIEALWSLGCDDESWRRCCGDRHCARAHGAEVIGLESFQRHNLTAPRSWEGELRQNRIL